MNFSIEIRMIPIQAVAAVVVMGAMRKKEMKRDKVIEGRKETIGICFSSELPTWNRR